MYICRADLPSLTALHLWSSLSLTAPSDQVQHHIRFMKVSIWLCAKTSDGFIICVIIRYVYLNYPSSKLCETAHGNVHSRLQAAARSDTEGEKIAPSDCEVWLFRGQCFCDANVSLFWTHIVLRSKTLYFHDPCQLAGLHLSALKPSRNSAHRTQSGESHCHST